MHAYYFFIYSLILKLYLSKKSPLLRAGFHCGAEWARTTDSRIFSPMLYQLSYSTAEVGAKLNNFDFATNILINNF